MGKGGSKIKPKDLKDLKANTDFTETEIKEWYRNFSNGCPDGILRKDDLESMFLDMFPEGDAKIFTDNVFRTYDTNNDGTLDFREFMIGISVTSRGSFDQKIQWAFELYDQDGNGAISREEAIDILTVSVVRNVRPITRKTLLRQNDKII
jgi:Ca2+-binding EF-hand superfamily protein